METWNGIFLRIMTNDLKPYQSNTASSTCRDGIYLEFTPALSMDDKSRVHVYISYFEFLDKWLKSFQKMENLI